MNGKESENGREEYRILICDGSPEGVFTGIYQAYERKYDHSRTRIQIGEDDQPELFAHYSTVEPDRERAEKVERTIRRRFGEECRDQILYALSSPEADRGQAVYQTLVRGLSGRVRGRLLECLSDPCIHRTFELARGAGNEIHHLMGFLRFEETDEGILFAEIGPKNSVVPFLMPHFSDRLPGENFIIHDRNRGLYGIHRAHTDWFLVSAPQGRGKEALTFSGKEKQIQELFRFFCHKITIEERRNEKLQRQMLPLRFQEYMVEFGENG